MIGIYNDEFITFLEEYCGADNVKVKSSNIIIPCPFCEYGEEKSHYHLWISNEAPMFQCFHAGCPKKSGSVAELVKKISGFNISEKFIDKDLVKDKQIEKKPNGVLKEIRIPEINENEFKSKSFFIRKRLGFNNFDLNSVKGLIFDFNKFVNLNKNIIKFEDRTLNLSDYIQSNFVGFITEKRCIAVFRNMDTNSKIKHIKVKLQTDIFPDYYKLNGSNPRSDRIVLAEGAFDILSEYIFNSLNLRDKVKLYASPFSPHYQTLIKSIVFNERIYQPDVIILSDRDVKLDYYEKLKFYNKHIIKSLTIYYNKGGKDFNIFPIIPEKFIIS